MTSALLFFTFLAMGCQAIEANNPDFNGRLRSLFLQEENLAGYVSRWEWNPSFSTEFQKSTLLRNTLVEENKKERHMSEIPQLDELLAPRSVVVYYFVHFLTSDVVHSVYAHDFHNLKDSQRTNMYRVMRQHCEEKASNSSAVFEHMETEICKNVNKLEELLGLVSTYNDVNKLWVKEDVKKKNCAHPEFKLRSCYVRNQWTAVMENMRKMIHCKMNVVLEFKNALPRKHVHTLLTYEEKVKGLAKNWSEDICIVADNQKANE